MKALRQDRVTISVIPCLDALAGICQHCRCKRAEPRDRRQLDTHQCINISRGPDQLPRSSLGFERTQTSEFVRAGSPLRVGSGRERLAMGLRSRK